MQCKLSNVVYTILRLRLAPAPHASTIRAVLLAFALLVGTSAVHAQGPEASSQKAEAPKTEAMAPGTISGTVFLPCDLHASQVAVTLKSHDAGVFRSFLTDYDGHFEVPSLPVGTYEVSIEEQGYEPYRSTAEFDGTSLKLELRMAAFATPQPAPNAYTISVRELNIPGKAQNEYHKGLQQLAKKDQNGSLSHFMKAVQLFPGYFEALYHAGIVHTNLGHLEKAMQSFQRAVVTSGGRYAKAVFGVGYLHYLQGRPAQAETTIRRGLEIDPNSPDGYVILGMTLLRLNRTDEAERSAREALLRDPNAANAYLVLADSCAHRQNYQEQIQDLDAYLKMDPNGSASTRAHEIRAVAQRLLDRSQPPN